MSSDTHSCISNSSNVDPSIALQLRPSQVAIYRNFSVTFGVQPDVIHRSNVLHGQLNQNDRDMQSLTDSLRIASPEALQQFYLLDMPLQQVPQSMQMAAQMC